jgi:integrase
MADIFISYSSQHSDLTRSLATEIEAHFGEDSVWWDQAGLRAGDRFSPEITRALDEAKAVVVVWTTGAVASDWVYAEAVRAASQRKIVTVREAELDPSTIPLPFNVFQTCLVTAVTAVLDGISRRLGGERSRLPSEMPGHGFRSFLLDSKQEMLPAWAAARGPASLLLAKYGLVPFNDIHRIKAEFVQWATGTLGDGPLALGRLVYAPAGLGKTRAMIEIADELTRTYVGWHRFKKVEVARIRYLTVAEAERLMNACDPELRPLVRSGLETGCRYGDLITLEVCDFNSDAGTLAIRQSKSGKPRHAVLTEEGAVFFGRHCAGRGGHELMFRHDDGGAWQRSEQARPMAEACTNGEIKPAISFHILRHTWASLAVMNGTPLLVVAKNLGHTDTRMVEKHYWTCPVFVDG